MNSDDLFTAIWNGDESRVHALLDEQPALAHQPNTAGMTPLLAATYARQPAIIEALTAAGAPVDLFVASALGRLADVTALLDDDPDALTAFSADGWTALHLAAHFGTVEVVRTLLQSGSDVHSRSRNRIANQPLHAACAGACSRDVVMMLLDHGADVQAKEHGGFTPLHEAAQNGNLELTRMLMDAGADTDATTDDGKTPADLAKDTGSLDVLTLLRP